MVLAMEVTDWDSSKSVAELNWYSKGILIYFSLELISTFKIILVTSWWTVEITGMPGEINLLCITFISIFVDFFCFVCPIHGLKFVSDLRLVGDFLRVLRVPLPIKLTATI